jgi:uncharacterized protein (DUF1697 family)
VTRYAVLLRAVNVGGHNKVPMARLREIAEGLGYSDVATYVQSGNLVITAAPKAAAVERAVAEALRAELDVDVDVVARTLPELQAVMAANPFSDGVAAPTKLHVSFLTGAPTAPGAADLDGEQFGRERFALGDRCLYLWYADGAGRSKMAAAPWERWLGVRGTARNWRTVQTLADMLAL